MFIRNDASESPRNERWRRYEQIFAIALAIFSASKMVIDGAHLSDSLAATHTIVGLQPSFWTDSRPVDLADGQLRGFRGNLLLLTATAIGFIMLHRLCCGQSLNLRSHLRFYAAMGIGYGWYMHGPGVLFLLLWITINHFAARFTAHWKGFGVLIWVSNLTFLIHTAFRDGYKFAAFHESLSWLDHLPKEMAWHRTSNMSFLKLISFLMDYHWAVICLPEQSKEKHMERCTECSTDVDCIKFRQQTHACDYSLLSSIAYVLYPPLFIAGPTLPYNAWISQVVKPQQTFDFYRKVTYFLRLVFALFLLELFIHFLYFPTIANSPENKKLWLSLSAYEMCIVSYLVLNWIWLKFLVIWRFFRLWAICDGIESVENMGKCISNSYSLEDFWRSWHKAFNQWLIRYLFIPLGGGKYKLLNVWVIFGFVAIWHDLTLHLLVWGWGICLFLVPEILAKAIFNAKRFDSFRQTITYNWLSACAGATCGFSLILVNMVGFSYGVDGFSSMIEKLTSSSGLIVLAQCWVIAVLEVHFLMSLRRPSPKSKLS